MRKRRFAGEKPLYWTGSSRKDLLDFPEAVVDNIGYALGVVQHGGYPPSAKPWKGLGPGVHEIVESDGSGAFRAVYVLHAFQKKSPSGVRTARTDVGLIEKRLQSAKEDYRERYGEETD